jgi:hypothetical protein
MKTLPLAAAGVAAAMTLTLVAACAEQRRIEAPAELRPAPNELLAMILPARGVQIYECRARTGDGHGFAWTFVAPDAQLFDHRGVMIGRHGAGPVWKSRDGSLVTGAVRARSDAPVPGAVPWLLLAAKSAGPAGEFSRITSIQRVNTAGGVAPGAGCSSDSAGKQARVPYTADYYFYSTR